MHTRMPSWAAAPLTAAAIGTLVSATALAGPPKPKEPPARPKPHEAPAEPTPAASAPPAHGASAPGSAAAAGSATPAGSGSAGARGAHAPMFSGRLEDRLEALRKRIEERKATLAARRQAEQERTH